MLMIVLLSCIGYYYGYGADMDKDEKKYKR